MRRAVGWSRSCDVASTVRSSARFPYLMLASAARGSQSRYDGGYTPAQVPNLAALASTIRGIGEAGY